MSKLSAETIEKLEWLKSRLRKYPHRYDQGEWCGTQACLAGFCWPRMIGSKAVTISVARVDYATSKTGDSLTAAWSDWLDVTFSEAMRLFAPRWCGSAANFNRISTDTDEQAVEKACQRIDLFVQSGGTK